MQLIENIPYTSQCQNLGGTGRPEHTEGTSSYASKRLVVLVVAALVGVIGPVILNTATQVCLAALPILLEICRVGLVTYQVFGTCR